MNGKGSKRRPEDAKRIADNWALWQANKEKEKLARYVPVRKLKKERAA